MPDQLPRTPAMSEDHGSIIDPADEVIDYGSISEPADVVIDDGLITDDPAPAAPEGEDA